MPDRVPQIYPYYLRPQYLPPQTHAVCEVVQPPGTSINALYEIARDQGLAIKALQKAVRAPATSVELRALAVTNEKTAGQLADHTRAITEQADIISRQASKIEQLQHDSAVLIACIVVMICVALGRMLISSLFKRKSATLQTTKPRPDDIVGAFLRSTNGRS
jgi:Sec-independent protein translocase protein TatA